MRAVLLAVLLASAPIPALADDTPWSKDVPEPTRRDAEKLFEEGNDLFAKQAHAPAADKYRAALALWDHPLVEFNLAVTLIRLDRVLEAADALEKALRYADKPFKPELYQQALDYQALLRGRLGYVEVACEQAGASITLDGKAWFACPGTRTVRVHVGEHTVVGDLAKHLPINRRVIVPGGGTVRERIVLEPLDTAIKLSYPYRRWVPWTVAAGGFAVGLAGLGVWLAGRGQLDAFAQNFERDCMAGCEKDLSQHQALRDQRDSAELKGTIGVSLMAAGGAAAIGGFVFAMVVNTPKRVLPTLEVTPSTGGGRASVRWRF